MDLGEFISVYEADKDKIIGVNSYDTQSEAEEAIRRLAGQFPSFKCFRTEKCNGIEKYIIVGFKAPETGCTGRGFHSSRRVCKETQELHSVDEHDDLECIAAIRFKIETFSIAKQIRILNYLLDCLESEG
jgi:hypothetical protein